MAESNMPSNAKLKNLVVQVGDSSTDQNEVRRVSDKMDNITVVRRKGEGSRAIFDRDEINNYRRITETDEPLTRHRINSSSCTDIERTNDCGCPHSRLCRDGRRYERTRTFSTMGSRVRRQTCHGYDECLDTCEEHRYRSDYFAQDDRYQESRRRSYSYDCIPGYFIMGHDYLYGYPYHDVFDSSPLHEFYDY